MVTGVELDRAKALCGQAQRACGEVKGEVCQVATEHLVRLIKADRDAKAYFVDTPQHRGHGAFQTELMRPSQLRLRAALRKALPAWRSPRCAVYFNTMGAALPAGADPSLIVDLLSTQLTSTVLWEQTIRQMQRDRVEEFVELSPTPRLRDHIKKISIDAWQKTSWKTLNGNG